MDLSYESLGGDDAAIHVHKTSPHFFSNVPQKHSYLLSATVQSYTSCVTTAILLYLLQYFNSNKV